MKRRNLLAAAAAGGLGAVLGAGAARAATVGGAAPLAAEPTVEPSYGAGLFDVDPDQGGVSQSPNVVVTGNVTVLPEDWGF